MIVVRAIVSILTNECAVLMLACLYSCGAVAVSQPVAVVAPHSLDDFDDIPVNQCRPELHGMFLSYEMGNRILDDGNARDKACAKVVLHAETERQVAELRCPRCEDARRWALVGKVSVGVGSVLVLTIGGLAVKVIVDDVARSK